MIFYGKVFKKHLGIPEKSVQKYKWRNIFKTPIAVDLQFNT